MGDAAENKPVKQDKLFSPLSIGSLKVGARLFKTATAETRATEDGFVGDDLLEFYEPIAAGGTPLIITGNLYVMEKGKSTFRQPGADKEDKIPGLKSLADMIHGYGGTVFGQINHCGRQVMPQKGQEAVSASGVREKAMGTRPRSMSANEVREAIEAYGRSAEILQRAGWDGVQIHAGHGYLISQFLTPYTNRRNDAYGGSFVRRLRFLLEVYYSVRERVGEDFPVIMKINGMDCLPFRQGLPNRELVKVARILENEGLDGVEITVGHYESGGPMLRGKFGPFLKGLMDEGLGFQLPWVRRWGLKYTWPGVALAFNMLWPPSEGFNLEHARAFKEKLSIPVITVGGFQTREKMEQAISQGRTDAVSAARSFIADPYLFAHVKNGSKGPLCNFCNGCIARAGRMPLDCFEPEIKEQKDILLAAAADRAA